MRVTLEQFKAMQSRIKGVKVKVPKPKMNGTELLYSNMLEIQKRNGEIFDYQFEGITLKLATGVRYTPDFLVIKRMGKINFMYFLECHETKGGFIRDDSRVKFQIARKQFPCFAFKMMQWKNKVWNEIYSE